LKDLVAEMGVVVQFKFIMW